MVEACGWSLGPGDPSLGDRFVLMSCVLIYCRATQAARMLEQLLTTDNIRAILVVERNPSQAMVERLKRTCVRVVKLMRQDVQRDERQLLFLGPHSPHIDASPA